MADLAAPFLAKAKARRASTQKEQVPVATSQKKSAAQWRRQQWSEGPDSGVYHDW